MPTSAIELFTGFLTIIMFLVVFTAMGAAGYTAAQMTGMLDNKVQAQYKLLTKELNTMLESYDTWISLNDELVIISNDSAGYTAAIAVEEAKKTATGATDAIKKAADTLIEGYESAISSNDEDYSDIERDQAVEYRAIQKADSKANKILEKMKGYLRKDKTDANAELYDDAVYEYNDTINTISNVYPYVEEVEEVEEEVKTPFKNRTSTFIDKIDKKVENSTQKINSYVADLIGGRTIESMTKEKIVQEVTKLYDSIDAMTGNSKYVQMYFGPIIKRYIGENIDNIIKTGKFNLPYNKIYNELKDKSVVSIKEFEAFNDKLPPPEAYKSVFSGLEELFNEFFERSDKTPFNSVFDLLKQSKEATYTDSDGRRVEKLLDGLYMLVKKLYLKVGSKYGNEYSQMGSQIGYVQFLVKGYNAQLNMEKMRLRKLNRLIKNN